MTLHMLVPHDDVLKLHVLKMKICICRILVPYTVPSMVWQWLTIRNHVFYNYVGLLHVFDIPLVIHPTRQTADNAPVNLCVAMTHSP